jgi:hypothetical protein
MGIQRRRHRTFCGRRRCRADDVRLCSFAGALLLRRNRVVAQADIAAKREPTPRGNVRTCDYFGWRPPGAAAWREQSCSRVDRSTAPDQLVERLLA